MSDYCHDIWGRFTGLVSVKDHGDSYKVIYHKNDIIKLGRKTNQEYRNSKFKSFDDLPDDSPPWPVGKQWDEPVEESREEEEKPKRKRFLNNVSRARTKIKEYANCNEFEWFVTFTLDPKRYDRHNLKKFMKDLGDVIRNERKKKGYKLQYLLIPEMHQDGAWHLHGLFMGLPEEALREFTLEERLPQKIHDKIRAGKRMFDFPRYSNKFGYCTVEKIKNKAACANYITKYISKSLEEIDSSYRLFYASRGLNKAKLVFRGKDEKLEKHEYKFENEWCKINWWPKKLFHEIFPNLCLTFT